MRDRGFACNEPIVKGPTSSRQAKIDGPCWQVWPVSDHERDLMNAGVW